ncbi:MAG: YoaK family protein [Alphaproteobacteria bacterium]
MVVLWAALLAGIAGYVDAICYLLLGQSFAANMTGNLIEVGMTAAQGQERRAAWLVAVLMAFFVGVLLARLVVKASGSSRLLLLIEAGLILLAATGRLHGVETPVLAAAMALQNEVARHSGLGVNVGFVTGDMQRLGGHMIAAFLPKYPKPEGNPRATLAVLVFYAIGAAIGTAAALWGAATLGVAAAAIAGTALSPTRWTRFPDRH